jgi:hypothetical protein
MTEIGNIPLKDSIIIFYANEITLLVGAVRPPTAFSKIEKYLVDLTAWATKYGLKFSAAKSHMLSLKGSPVTL